MRTRVRPSITTVLLASALAVACGQDKAPATGTTTGSGSTPTAPTTPPATEPPPPTTPQTCTYAVAANPDDFERDGGNGTLAINTAAGCKWTVKSDATWAAIEGPTQGEGAAALKLSVLDNADPQARRATLTVQDKTAIVTQPGQGDCTYSVSPIVDLIPRAVTSGKITLSTNRGCAWTTSTDASWFHLRQASGSGSATIAYEADSNPETRYAVVRTALLAFRWRAPTAGQNVRINQSGACNIGIYAATGGLPAGATYSGDTAGGALTASAAGGAFHFWIQTDPFMGCAWVLEGGDAWVQSVGPRVGERQTGDADLFFTLPTNASPQPRRAVFVMDGKPLAILQQGR